VQPCAGLFPLCVSEPASVQARSLSRAEQSIGAAGVGPRGYSFAREERREYVANDSVDNRCDRSTIRSSWLASDVHVLVRRLSDSRGRS